MGRTASALMWSALAAGLSMGFSFLVQAILLSELPKSKSRHLIASLGSSIGFVFVILARRQLFTESTLPAVLPVLTRRDLRTVGKTLRLWLIVLLSNHAVRTAPGAGYVRGRPRCSPDDLHPLCGPSDGACWKLRRATMLKMKGERTRCQAR